MSFARSRCDSRSRQRADVQRSGFPQYPRARVERRARRAHVVDEDNPQPAKIAAPSKRERASHVRVAFRRRQIRLRLRRARAAECLDNRQLEISRELERLVESTRAAAPAMEWNGYDDRCLGKDVHARLSHAAPERTRKRAATRILHRVQNRAQRSLVRTDRAAARDCRWPTPAAGTLSRCEAEDPPRRQRISTRRANRRDERRDCVPAGGTDRAAGWMGERCVAGRARRREHDGKETVRYRGNDRRATSARP